MTIIEPRTACRLIRLHAVPHSVVIITAIGRGYRQHLMEQAKERAQNKAPRGAPCVCLCGWDSGGAHIPLQKH